MKRQAGFRDERRALTQLGRGPLAAALIAVVGGLAQAPAAFAAPACTTVCYVDATNGNDSTHSGATIGDALKSIQAAIDAVDPGGEVRVLPGDYDETAAGRSLNPSHSSGVYQFGLFFGDAKDGVTVMGVTAADVPITDATATEARITTNAQNNFGYSGIFVEADDITIRAVEIGPNAPSNNKTIEVIGDNFTLTDNNFDVTPNPYGGSVYFNDWSAAGDEVVSYHITNNRFLDGTSIAISSGAGLAAPLAGNNREIAGNSFDLHGDLTYAALSFNGKSDDTGGPGWYTKSVGGAVITGNTFANGGQYIRARGQYEEADFDWQSYFSGNTFDHAAVALRTEIPFDPRPYTYTTSYTFVNVRLIEGVIQSAIGHASSGDIVLAGPQTFTENVVVNKSLTLKGSGAASTALHGAGTGAGITLGGAGLSNVTIRDLTVTAYQDGIASSGGALSDVTLTSLATVANGRHGIVIQNFGVTNLTLDAVNSSNNGTPANAGRGLWIINGAKTNVAVTNSTFNANGLVGVDLSDGSVNGATITGNTVNANHDSGIAVLGSIGPNPTLIADNTVTDNHRYGIEVKNSTGNGALSGAGSLVVSGNTVTRTASVATPVPGGSPPATEKDYGGIVVIRRSPNLGNGNPDQPSGTVITGNMVTGFQRKSAPTQGDGFGVVVEGAGNVVTGNTISNNNVGVQIQSGNTVNVFGTDAFDRGDGGTIGTPSSALINRNNITDNTDDALRNGGAPLTDATCNWYGAATGPGAGDVTGSFTTSPFLYSSNLGGLCPAGVPGAPVDVSAIAGDAQVTLSWTPPATDGGMPVIGYVVTGDGTCTPVPATATSCVVTGLTNGVAVTFTIAAFNVVGTGPGANSPTVTPQAPPVLPAIPDYVPVGPKRLFDTREGQETETLRTVTKSKIGPNSVLEVRVTDLAPYVPAAGVGAVSINVTVDNATSTGFITVYDCGARPLASSVNYRPNAIVANAVIAPVSATGTICFYSQHQVDIVVDLNGYFNAGKAFTGVGPARVFDTRAGQSPAALRAVAKQRVGGGNVLEVELTDLAGLVPATGVGSVSLNVTVEGANQAGFVTVYPCDQRELVSNVNFVATDAVANAVITPVSATGTVCFYAQFDVDIIVDINGWLKSPSGHHPLPPKRIFDTRAGESPDALRVVPKIQVGPAHTLEVKLTDIAGVPATGVGAVSLNVTATNSHLSGFVTVYACGTRELVSSVNFAAGQTVANAVLSPVSATGTVCFYALNDTDIVVDINGWFVEP